jgi:hypothetical protein
MTRAKRPPAELRLFGRRLPLPRHRAWRIAAGVGLVLGGLVGFLPVLGFWMIPLGLAVLAWDIPWIDRQWRKAEARRRLARQRLKRRARARGKSGDDAG